MVVFNYTYVAHSYLNKMVICYWQSDEAGGITIPGKADEHDKILYALKGVIVHMGSLQSGHYYTYLRKTVTAEQLPTTHVGPEYYDESASLEGDWYCANDNKITHISEAQHGIPIEVSSSLGYLLFYEQLPLKLSNNNDCDVPTHTSYVVW